MNLLQRSHCERGKFIPMNKLSWKLLSEPVSYKPQHNITFAVLLSNDTLFFKFPI